MNPGSYKTVSKEEMKEEWLLIKAAKLDPAAFRPLYDRYFATVFKFIFKRIGNEELTAELCSMVFLKALKRLPGYEFRGVPFSAWLLRIAVNEVGQYFRKNKRNKVVAFDDFQVPTLSTEMQVDDLDGEDPELLQRLMVQVLDELKEEDLELIELRFFEELPFRDIAEILGITESNAKVKTYRLLERMKKSILGKKAKE